MGRTSQFAEPNAPLTPAVFYILLALATRDRHGYDILKQVEAASSGGVRLGPGTLYVTLRNLLDAGFVVEVDDPAALAPEGPRRRCYRLTETGRGRLAGEIRRMQHAVSLAPRAVLEP